MTKRKIAVSEKVGKSKQYCQPPTDASVVEPAEDDSWECKASWFSWKGSGYYPICIKIGEEGKEQIEKQGPRPLIAMTISCVNSGNPVDDFSCETPPLSGGMYWFKAVDKVYVKGTFTIRFHCPSDPDVEELKFSMEVKGLHSSSSNNNNNNNSSNNIDIVPSNEADKNATRRSSRKSMTSSESIQEDMDVVVTKSPRKRERSEVAILADSSKSMEVEEEKKLKSENAAEQKSKELRRLQRHRHIFVQSVLECPQMPLVDVKNRIEQPLPLMKGDKEISSSSTEPLTISGPALEVTFPVSVVRAILDDRENSVQLCDYMRLYKKYSDKKVFSSLENLKHPTVSELLNNLQTKAASQSEQKESIVHHMRCLFEYCFESELLYPYEREVYATRLANMRTHKKPIADEFGVYMYLRLLVFIVMSTEVSTTKDDGEDTMETSLSQSSSSRQPTGSHRQNRKAYVQLQEVVTLAIKSLDEQAHFIFY